MMFCWQEMIIYEHNEHIVPVTAHQGQIFIFIFVSWCWK